MFLLLYISCALGATSAWVIPGRSGARGSSLMTLLAGRKGLTAGGVIAENKKARNEYEMEYKLEAGIVLTGTEVKACRQAGKVIISDAHADIRNGEAWLFGLHIGTCDRTASREDHFPKRDRKLLLRRQEVLKAEQRLIQQNMEMVPLRLVFSEKNYVKVEIGVGKQKTVIDKRDDMKKKDANRDIKRAMKGMY